MGLTGRWRKVFAGLLVPSVLVAAALASGCGGKKTTYDALFVEVSATGGLASDSLALLLVKQLDDGTRVVFPRDPEKVAQYTADVTGRDLSKDPYLVKVTPGETFSGVVTVVVTAKTGAVVDALASVEADLDRKAVVKVLLVPRPEGCDADGDGFPDCAKDGCCAAGDLSDCNDEEAKATPVGYEDECTRCGFGKDLAGDSIDDDCDGTAARCRDADGDNAVDCAPTWCNEESAGSPACVTAQKSVDCDPKDKTIFPGNLEICDYKDNDCNGDTDDGAMVTVTDWDKQVKGIGQTCGTGVCEGGKVECNLETGKAWCSTDGSKAEVEDCKTPEDDNCNGLINDPSEGCTGGDLDGDGVIDSDEDDACGPMAKYHSEIFPESDTLKHANPEPCCLPAKKAEGDVPWSCDQNCDGKVTWCTDDDVDGDGYPAGPDTDCNDNDPTIHASAPEKCGDGVDQDCKGGDLKCSLVVDKDNDGYSEDNGDCNDDPAKGGAKVFPGAAELCNGIDDDCDGYTDDGNPEAGDACGSDEGECAKGTNVCAHETDVKPAVQCNGAIDPIGELCDGKDNDCDGKTDEPYHYKEAGAGESCTETADGKGCEGLPGLGEECEGVGECGRGTVVCVDEGNAGCSTNPPLVGNEAKAELCDNLDNDCDGMTDESLESGEVSECSLPGVCDEGKASIIATCMGGKWFCNYSKVPYYEDGEEKSCDNRDNDCNGETDEDFLYSDAIHPDPVVKGMGCGTGSCANGTVECAPDGTKLYCNTTGGVKEEICDGLDNDCDSLTDEGFAYEGLPVWVDSKDTKKGHTACKGIGECGKHSGLVECAGPNGARCSTNPGGSDAKASPDLCDGLDNDCDNVVDENLTDVNQSDCLKVGVCGDQIEKVKASCLAGEWLCDYSKVAGYQSGVEQSCDGLDNDCDGSSDEDFTVVEWDKSVKMKGDACGTGLCAGGVAQCSADDKKLECSTAVLSKPEVCDGKDNDCDGSKDEDQLYNGIMVGQACVGMGECGKYPGTVECHTDSQMAVCSTNPNGTSPKATEEICDAKDNNCNGTTDEGLTIDSGDNPCLRVGVCASSLVNTFCAAGKWTCDYKSIATYQTPVEISCDGLDNDCDGSTDEDFTFLDFNGVKRKKGDPCGTGLCASGQVQCKSDKVGLVCSTGTLATTEKCDGKDNDCDGQTDEATNATCDDAKTCTTDACTSGACTNTIMSDKCLIAGTCYEHGTVNPTNACQACEATKSKVQWTNVAENTSCNFDSNGCTKDDRCVAGVCTIGTPVSCASLDDQCNTGKCRSTGNNTSACDKSPINQGQTCNDGQACTKTDHCELGTCVGTTYDCDDKLDCTTDSCNGDGTCTHDIKAGFCVIGGACIAEDTTNPANQCQACRPTTNETGWTNKADSTPCNDGDECNVGEACKTGACTGGTAPTCNDNNVCTSDSCNKATGCVYTPLEAGTTCDDGKLCTHTDKCQLVTGKMTCAGTAYSCNDEYSCNLDICKGDGTCDNSTIIANWCLIKEGTTGPSACYPSGTKQDGNACHVCTPSKIQTAWSDVADGSVCSDGNACTLGDQCLSGACTPSGPVVCEDNNSCTSDACVNGVCKYTPIDGACSDGDECTLNDTCAFGQCVPGTPKICNEPNSTCLGGVCVCGSTTCSETTADQCTLETCMCGSSAACNAGGINPKCLNKDCRCSTTEKCNAATANKCENGSCKCGTSLACNSSINPSCVSGTCSCNGTVCTSTTADACSGTACVCGTSPACTAGSINPTCIGAKCTCNGTVCSATMSTSCNGTSCMCGSNPACAGPLVDKCDGTKCVCGSTGAACTTTTADNCASGTCKCGVGAACNPKTANSCIGGVCMCGGNLACNSDKVDTCTAGVCMCGTHSACGSNEECINGNCE